ncbi:MAG: metal-dependent hydrolase [Gammaproteobacteria bacterium]|nr:metal-dependent hydrolase [Gammaproteobacteria bacterium]
MKQPKMEKFAGLKARRVNVQFTDDIPKYWANGDPMVSCFFAALSTIFPDGERFFIHSVRNYIDQVEEGELKEAMMGFIGQEGSHSRTHQAYNSWLAKQGYPVARLVSHTKHALLWFRKVAPPKLQIAFTAAFEHFTAILGESSINEVPEIQAEIEKWHPVMRKVWLWHGVEENEHKAVAFDVYQFAGGGYALRVAALIMVSLYIWIYLSGLTLYYLRLDGQLKPSVLFNGFKVFWVNPGMFRRIIPSWLSFFKPGFHPWQHDNSKQLEKMVAQLEADGLFDFLSKAA